MNFKGLRIDVIKREQVMIFRWDGELNPDIYYEIVNFLKDKVIKYNSIVDLKNVRYISSAGVSALLTLNKMASDAGKKMVIFGLTASAQQVLHLTRLYNNFNISETEEEALKSVSPSS